MIQKRHGESWTLSRHVRNTLYLGLLFSSLFDKMRVYPHCVVVSCCWNERGSPRTPRSHAHQRVYSPDFWLNIKWGFVKELTSDKV